MNLLCVYSFKKACVRAALPSQPAFFRWTFAVWLGRSHSESHGNQLSTGKTQLKLAHGEPVPSSQRLAMRCCLSWSFRSFKIHPFLKSRNPKKQKLSFLKSDLRVLRMIRQGWDPPYMGTTLPRTCWSRPTCWSRRTSPDQSLRQSQTLADSRRSHRSNRRRWAAEWGRWNSTELQWAGWIIPLRCWAVGKTKATSHMPI